MDVNSDVVAVAETVDSDVAGQYKERYVCDRQVKITQLKLHNTTPRYRTCLRSKGQMIRTDFHRYVAPMRLA